MIGEVTDGDRLVINWHGETVVDVPPRTVAHDGPVYRRPVQRPTRPRTRCSPTTPTSCPGRPPRASCARRSCGWPPARTCAAGPGSPTSTTATCAATPCWPSRPTPGMIRIDEQTGRGVAVATDCNARFVALDPYTGAQLALAEAYRNVATSGAVPLAVTNCLNFGSPEDPHVMWQFQQAVRGLADGCAQLGIPVTGGNVSFYNQTGAQPILPTPVVGVLGVIDDVARRVPLRLHRGRRRDGAARRDPRRVGRQRVGARGARSPRRPAAGGRPGRRAAAGPAARGRRGRRLRDRLARPVRRRAGPGAGRVVPGRRARRGRSTCRRRWTRSWRCSPSRRAGCWSPRRRTGWSRCWSARPRRTCPAHPLGTTGGHALAIGDIPALPLDELRAAWTGTLPALFG